MSESIWIWADLGWSQPHGCKMWGWRWATDTPEVRKAHPQGRQGKATEPFGWSGGYDRQPDR